MALRQEQASMVLTLSLCVQVNDTSNVRGECSAKFRRETSVPAELLVDTAIIDYGDSALRERPGLGQLGYCGSCYGH